MCRLTSRAQQVIRRHVEGLPYTLLPPAYIGSLLMSLWLTPGSAQLP
jgi:hypothetical protein